MYTQHKYKYKTNKYKFYRQFCRDLWIIDVIAMEGFEHGA